MLRWRPERYSVGVSGNAAVLLKQTGETVSVLASLLLDGFISGPHALNWTALFTTLFVQAKLRRGVSLRVTLGEEWVRHAWVPHSPGVRDYAELQALVRARFEALYADPMEQWVVQADWKVEQGMLACAVPQDMLEGLKDTCADHGLRLKSLAPWSVRCINRHRQHIPDSAWVCCLGTRALTAILVNGAMPVHARSFARPHTPELNLGQLLDAELLRGGHEPPGVMCLFGEQRDLATLKATASLPLGFALAWPAPRISGLDTVQEAYGVALT